MNPGDNGKDDEHETHTTFYNEWMMDEAESSEADKPTRTIGVLLTAGICLVGWVVIWFFIRTCNGG